MASNELRTRIRSKYDTFANWSSSSFVPLAGEICVAVIPNGQSGPNEYQVGNPTNSGLSPYAIGVKVGDGYHIFNELPWIQAIAGDVYSWAKAATPPHAQNITVTYNSNQSSNVQAAITGIEQSLGNIVTQGVDASTLGAALAQLQEQLAGQTAEVFNSNPMSEGENPAPTYPTKIVRTITQNGLTITATGSALEEADLPDISLSKISDLAFNTTYNQSTNKAATMADINTAITQINNSITGAMKFIGISTTPISDGGLETPTINGASYSIPLERGDVVLYRRTIGEEQYELAQEYVWTGEYGWELLGDEGSYAVKGSISKADLTSDFQSEINGKLDATTAASTYVAQETNKRLMTNDEGTKLAGIEAGAQVNIIETVSVNGSALQITEKNVNVEIPILKIKQSSGSGASASVTEITPAAADKSITFDEIAFNGEVRNLKQTDNTILVFDCGSATRLIDPIS